MLRNHRQLLFRFGAVALVAGILIIGVRLTALRAQPGPVSRQEACANNLHEVWAALVAYKQAHGRMPTFLSQIGLSLYCPSDPDREGLIAKGAIRCDYGLRNGVMFPGGGRIVDSPYPTVGQVPGPHPLVVCRHHVHTVPVTLGANGKLTGGQQVGDYLVLESDGTVVTVPVDAARWVNTKWLNPREAWHRGPNGAYEPVPGTVKPSDAMLLPAVVYPGEPYYADGVKTASEAKALPPIVYDWSPS